MQRDFHYYCIGVLARAAGFNSKDALTIAYASQYVDDSTESELIPIETEDGDLKFDPVRTSYTGLAVFQAVSWSAQKRVWIPFHFIPSQPFNPEEHQTFSFVTKPASPFARLLLERAAEEPMKNHKRRLCRIGVALHTYADSWSHRNFSGRKNRSENDVEGIYLCDRTNGKWKHLGIENLLFDALPQIGHAEAGFFPDLAFQKWKCTLKPSGKEIGRDNVEEFLQAAKDIYDRLQAMEKTNSEPSVPWQELEPKIRRLLEKAGRKPRNVDRLTLPLYRAYQAQEAEKRCKGWEKEFGHLFGALSKSFFYDRKAWREKALEGDVDWDDFMEEDWVGMLPRKVKAGFWDSLWVHFHRAALCQRHFVLENVP